MAIEVIGIVAICLVILSASFVVYRGLRAHASVMFLGLIRAAFIANFSRYGDLETYRVAVVNDTHGFFVRDSALWIAEVDDLTVVKSTARPLDLMTVDAALLKEAMTAVDFLHSDFANSDEEDDDDDE
jgi:hypothetical protein